MYVCIISFITNRWQQILNIANMTDNAVAYFLEVSINSHFEHLALILRIKYFAQFNLNGKGIKYVRLMSITHHKYIKACNERFCIDMNFNYFYVSSEMNSNNFCQIENSK